MLTIKSVNVFIGPLRVLDDVNLQVPPGCLIGLIGRNGAGKTTLLRAIMGFLPARTGSIELGHESLLAAPAHARAAAGIGYMPEDRKLVPDFTVEGNLLLPAWTHTVSDPHHRLDWVYGLIPEVREFANRFASELSGGQQKLVALARALMCGRTLLLLDEPFEGVAPVLARRLGEVIADLKKENISCLLADSSLHHAADLLDGIYRIERGVVAPEQA